MADGRLVHHRFDSQPPILRATDLLHANGRSFAAATSLAVLIYAGHNLVASLIAYGGGHWIDRTGPKRVFANAAGVYIVAYTLFGLVSGGWVLLVLAFVLAGAGIGLAETAESSLVARLLPDELRGSGFGVLWSADALSAHRQRGRRDCSSPCDRRGPHG